MTTNEQGYTSRFEKFKGNKKKQVSPPYSDQKDNKNELGKIVARLVDRIDGIEIKMVNVVNVVKLLQKYTEMKDTQYQKQKENDEYRKSYALDNVQQLEYTKMQNKITELQSIQKKASTQIIAMENLRLSLQRQSERKNKYSPRPHETMSNTLQSTSRNNARQIMIEIEEIMAKMEVSLREQLNRKIDICMNFFCSAAGQYKESRNSASGFINAVMIHEQLDNIKLTMNKVESDCNRNKMIVQAKVSQLINYIKSDRRKQKLSPYQKQARGLTSKNNNDEQSDNSIVLKNKNKSKSKSNQSNKSSKPKSKVKGKKITKEWRIDDNLKNNVFNRIEEQKKQKQMQLKEALRKKKQSQIKLKILK